MNNLEYYTTKEVASRIGKSVPTIHKYVEEGKLTPVEDLWGGYRGLLFEKEPIEQFIQEMPNEKPGLTLNEAADRLQTNRSTVQTYLNEGLVPYVKRESRGREVTFIKETDLKEFTEIHAERLKEDRLKQRHFYNRKNNEAIYHRFSSSSIQEARLFREGLGDWYFIVPKTGQTLSYNEGIYEHKLKPDYPVVFGKRTGTPGYAKLKLPLRYSLTYQFVDLLYQYAHVANMYMDMEEDRLIVLVKDCVCFDVSEELASFIQSRIDEGQARFQRGVLAIESEEETLSVRLSRETKQWIKQLADQNGSSMQEVASSIIEEYRKMKNKVGEHL
ncbi:helix-turn-helix domain-containing protein [Bacillus sp. 37MA]|uniref:helix-turn-helix domain-containing protein n=1 Tax=Bacillus sp. 37MA TaxID=1132442 RepID=UPI0003758EB1|nr:helix-turn-helix domain-containing protein [Bacillus sp. 37MA]